VVVMLLKMNVESVVVVADLQIVAFVPMNHINQVLVLVLVNGELVMKVYKDIN
jgi:hypothetical protein